MCSNVFSLKITKEISILPIPISEEIIFILSRNDNTHILLNAIIPIVQAAIGRERMDERRREKKADTY